MENDWILMVSFPSSCYLLPSLLSLSSSSIAIILSPQALELLLMLLTFLLQEFQLPLEPHFLSSSMLFSTVSSFVDEEDSQHATKT